MLSCFDKNSVLLDCRNYKFSKMGWRTCFGICDRELAVFGVIINFWSKVFLPKISIADYSIRKSVLEVISSRGNGMKIQAAVPDLWLLLSKVIKEYLGFMAFFRIVLIFLLLLGRRKVILKKILWDVKSAPYKCYYYFCTFTACNSNQAVSHWFVLMTKERSITNFFMLWSSN